MKVSPCENKSVYGISTHSEVCTRFLVSLVRKMSFSGNRIENLSLYHLGTLIHTSIRYIDGDYQNNLTINAEIEMLQSKAIPFVYFYQYYICLILCSSLLINMLAMIFIP